MAVMAGLPKPENISPETEAAMVVVDICTSWIYPAALRAIVELDVAHILAVHAKPPSMAMTAEELLQHMPEATCPSARNLERLLRLLTTQGLFAEHMSGDGTEARSFSLTRLSRCLVPGDGSYRSAVLLYTLGPESSATLEHLSDSVLKSTEPFATAHGENLFEFLKTHPAISEMFNNAFKDMGAHLTPRLLAQYRGFDSVHKLMDVGGNSGIMLAAIVERYPHIHGICFDLPEVVATNPNLPGVEHMGGNMFEKVPTGCDAIFMKEILHNWSDERCLQLLSNCCAALPRAGGKLIVVDQVMPRDTPLAASVPVQRRMVFPLDLSMQIHCEKGRERTAVELQGLLKQAGFTDFDIVAEVGPFHIMEARKEACNLTTTESS